MRLNPKQLYEVDGDYEILASYDVIREVVNGITIDSSKVTADGSGKKIIKKGMPMGKLANGKYAPYNSGATDGSEKPTVILKRQYDCTDGDVVAGGYEMAKLLSDRLPVTVDAALKSKMPLIQFT